MNEDQKQGMHLLKEDSFNLNTFFTPVLPKSIPTAKNNFISILCTQCKMKLALNEQASTYFLTLNYLYITTMRFIIILVSLTCIPFLVTCRKKQRPFFFQRYCREEFQDTSCKNHYYPPHMVNVP